MKHNTHLHQLDRAIACVGGLSKLAQAIGEGQTTLSNWRKRGTVLKAEYCTAIERATGGQVTRRDLRPNDWQQIWPELATPASPAPSAIEKEVTHG